MTNVDNSKVYEVVAVDPNFSLPFGVTDIGYSSPEEKNDSGIERSDSTGEIIPTEYNVESLGEMDGTLDSEDSVGESNEAILLPPDYISVVSQVMRQTSDGRYVVDVVLEVEDIPNVTGYEVGLTKL